MRPRISSIGLAVLTVLAACAPGESALPPGNRVIDTEASASVTDTGTGTRTDDEVSGTSEASEASAAFDTTPATTEAANPADSRPIATDPCESLTSDGYETRKLTREGLSDDALQAARANCGTALDQLEGAIEIEQRMAAFNASPEPLTAGDLVCDAGDFSLTVTNEVDHPIGVHASLRLVREDTEGPVGSTLQPLVAWSLEPGASITLTDRYQVNRGSDEQLTCEVDVTAFDATPGDADASLGETRVAELAVDDPAAWLPFLVVQGAAVIGTGDADLAAVVEDVRSTQYLAVVQLVLDPDASPVDSGTISVCRASIEQPSDRLMSVVYFNGLGESSQLQHGLFRRGNDDQWRWLSSSVYFDSQEYWDCGTPSSNL